MKLKLFLQKEGGRGKFKILIYILWLKVQNLTMNKCKNIIRFIEMFNLGVCE